MKQIFFVVGICGVMLGASVAAPSSSSLGIFQAYQDIGLNPKPGASLFQAGTNTYEVTGGGANIWGATDAFQFAYTKITGDVTFSADVKFVGKGTELHRKAALMIRQSLEASSAYADVALHGDGLTALQYRPSQGVPTAEFRAAMKSPLHLSITRQGNEFTISAGSPGDQPAMTGPVIVTMQDPVYLGLAVCAHNADVTETAVFSNVKISRTKER